jgi:uncharacterized protein YndB with AHSA1/START domain
VASHDYRFDTRWRVRASPEEVADIIGDPLALPRWWPSVYLSATESAPGDADGVGRVLELHTRGWLPYTLRWSFRVVEADRPRRFAIQARGDFEGTGTWTFTPDGDSTDVEFLWMIRARKSLLRWLSFLLRPAFSANHEWAMRRGLESLQDELARRRGAARAAAAG